MIYKSKSLDTDIDIIENEETATQLLADIDRHELLRQHIGRYNTVNLCYCSENESAVRYTPFILCKDAGKLIIRKERPIDEVPDTENTLIIEEGHCHTADFMEQTTDIPIPDDLVEYNFKYAKEAKRCGCCYCGSIFPGSEVTDCTRDSRGDIIGTAFCPVCGMGTVVVEKDDVTVTENNLWRWFLHMFSDKPMYKCDA